MADVADLRQVKAGNLRRLRAAAGWSQDELALSLQRVGIRWTRSVVAAAEAGTKTIDDDEVAVLAMALCGGNVQELYAGDGWVMIGTGRLRLAEYRAMLAGNAYGVTGSTTRLRVATKVYVGEAEQKAARKLGASVERVSAAAARLWRRSLTQERERVVAKRVDPSTPARSVQAIRGRVTRELVEQLAAELRED